jgi:hypothetical protein
MRGGHRCQGRREPLLADVADSKREREEQTPDVISFLIYDRNGKRVAYGTGPVAKGEVTVAPTSE